jgi:ferredoxin-NADP reductase
MPDSDSRHRVQILEKNEISHDVNRWVVEKPDGYTYRPGQATTVCLDRDGYRDEPRPFTFTGLPDDPTLEFTIKTYPARDGVTDELDEFKAGEHLLIDEPFGAIEYQGEGTFIAGGAGVTPFIAIFKQLFADHEMGLNRLIFANETADDVFLKTAFDQWLGDRVMHVLSGEDAPFAERGKVNRAFLQAHCAEFDGQYWYLCGPPGMGEELKKTLLDLGANEDKIVHEEWG